MKSVVKAGSKNDGGIWTDLEGRLERLNFPVGIGVYTPLFEAIHNALDAIEQSNVSKGLITITVEREPQLNVNDQLKKPQIVENIIIADNGKGFDTANLESFKTLDSRLKLKTGGKGVGRLFWLKAFEAVEIISIFEENGEKFKRKITFDLKNGCKDEPAEKIAKNSKVSTTVRLLRYKRLYESAYRSKKAATVASDIGKHFLPALLFGKPTTITLIDGDEKEEVSRKGLPEPEKEDFDIYVYGIEIVGASD